LRYNGTDNQYVAKLYGNPETTGLNFSGLVWESDNFYYVQIYGAPKIIGKNTQILKLSNRTNYIEFPIIYHVVGLKFLDYSLPDAVGLFKPYTTRIHFYNPSSFKPKFSYNFPIEFGRVDTLQTQNDFTEITFSPSKSGKYKFYVQSYGEIKNETGEIENILLGAKTINIEVIDPNKPAPGIFTGASSVDIKNW
jgi:hypothetical protein